MNRTNGGILAAIVLIALFIGSGGRVSRIGSTPQGTPENESRPENKGTKDQTKPETGPAEALPGEAQKWEASLRQIGRLADELHNATTTPPVPKEMLQAITDALKDVKSTSPGVIVATLPHPTETHLALFADRVIEAMQQAIQKSGYRFDRALMPWETREPPELDDIRKQWEREDLTSGLYRVPGLMVFRWAGVHPPGPNHVIVLLVAEKPTAGIDRVQFKVAVQIARELAKDQKDQHLLILGPTFSGSLPSMFELLKASAGDFARVTVASGTVTGRTAIQDFKAHLCDLNKESQESSKAKFRFATFQHDDQRAMDALLTFGRKYWNLKPADVVVVSESETEYGESQRQDEKEPSKLDKNRPEAGVLELHFPRGISHLRTAYEQQQKMQAATDATLRSPGALLHGPLGETRRGGDSVPIYATQSAVSQDAAMTGIIEELKLHGPRLVLVLATDPLDTLFLVRYIRGHYPHPRVVTRTADSLLRHEADDSLLRGVLALTTYSLRAGTEEYQQIPNPLPGPVFSSSDSKGEYNAAAALVSCISAGATVIMPLQNNSPALDWCTHKKDNVPGDFLFEYGPSWFAPQASPRGSPDLKLDVLGNDGFYPVVSLGDMPGEPMAERENNEGVGSEPPRWSHTGQILVVIGFAALTILLTLLWMRSVVFRAFDALKALAPAPEVPHCHALIAVFCAMVYLLALLPLWPLLDSQVHLQVLVLGMWLLLAAGGIILLWKQYSPRAGWALVYMLALMVEGVLLVRLISSNSTLRAFNYRWWHVDSGVSPLVPLAFLVIGLLWIFWHTLSGVALVETNLPVLPDIDDGTHPGAPTLPDDMIAISQRYQQRLRRFMLPFLDWRLTLPIGVAFLFIAAMYWGRRPFTTLEPIEFDYALTGVIAAVLWLLAAEVTRMLLVWMEAKKLLRALAHQPFSDGFKQVRLSWRQMTKLTVQQIQTLRADPQLCRHLPQYRVAEKMAHDDYFSLIRSQVGVPQAKDDFVCLTRSHIGVPQPKPESHSTAEDALWESSTALKTELAGVAASLCRKLQARPPADEVPPADQDQKEKRQELAVAEIGDNRKLEFALKDAATTEHDKCVGVVCDLYTSYLIAVLLRIRSMAASAVGVFVLFVVAIMSYPFEPRGPIRSILLVIFAALMTAIALVYAQMHRDEILSRITQTTSGKLGVDFWLRMVAFVGLPLISLLAYQFPSIGSFLFSWVEPSVRSIR